MRFQQAFLILAVSTLLSIGCGGGGSSPANPVVQAPSSLVYLSAIAIYTNGRVIAANVPSNSGGTATSYRVSPGLPAGLSLDANVGIISGTPTALTATGIFTVTASNSGGSAAAILTITVNDVPPAGLVYSTNPLVCIKGAAISASSPSGTGGPVVSYSVSPDLPAGLNLNTSSGIISGVPTAVAPLSTYLITASNSGGNTTVSLTITVNDAAPSSLVYTTAAPIYTKGKAISVNSPTNSGGAIVSYGVSPSLPVGLSLGTSTGILGGVPMTLAPAAAFIVTATNTGGSTTATLTITVNEAAPAGLAYSTASPAYTKGTAIDSNRPTSSGGPVVSYTVSPSLPAGLSLSSSTGILGGTPTTLATSAAYTVTATNTGGSTTATLTITVNDVPPSNLAYTSAVQVYTKGTAISSNSPTSSGGPVVSYAISPAIPAGLSLSTSTGILSGTPTALATSAAYVVTATNTGGSTTATLTITVNDVPPSSLAYTYAVQVYTKGTAISSNSPTSSGGPVVSYAISPALPAGLSLSSSTGILSGTPTALATSAAYVVTASNTGGSTTANLTITINDAAPSSLAYITAVPVYTKGTAISSNRPSNSGGAVVSYAISPALPAGLSLSTSTGILSGTPTVLATSASYTVTGTNTGGSTTATLTITVKDVPPSSLAYTSAVPVYTKGTAISSNSPTSSGGPVVSYAISPALPAGLSLSTSTGILSGTPTVIARSTVYTVQATNSGGSTNATLTLTVNDVSPNGLAYTYASANFPIGEAIVTNRPNSSGGTVNAYCVSPSLPWGLKLNTSTGVITGTPTTLTPQATYVVTAANAGGSTTVSLVFRVVPSSPTLTSINWPKASVGVRVFLTGTSLSSVAAVAFSGVPAPAFTVDSPTQITVTVPTGATTGPVSATSFLGNAVGPVFTVSNGPAPIIASIELSHPYLYNAVLIQGANLLSGSRVYIGSTLITENFISDAGLTGGWAYLGGKVMPNGKVKVEGPNGTAISTNDLIFTVPVPTITGLTPSSGHKGASIAVNGTDLQYILNVSFNGALAVPSTLGATQLTVFVPLDATTGPVSVINASGTAPGPTFTVLDPPTPVISHVTPPIGQPGNIVTLGGTYFTNASAVTFNGAYSTSFTVDSPLQIRATVPLDATTGTVQVTTPFGTGTGPIYSVVPDEMMPRINGLNPESGYTLATVIITGVNLLGASNVDFAGKGASSWRVVNDNLITARVPWLEGRDVSGPIYVTTPNGVIASPQTFTLKAFPNPLTTTVTSIVPNHGKPWEVVRISGTDLDKVTRIYFSGGFEMSQALFTVVSPTALDVVLPGRLKTGSVWFYSPYTSWGIVVSSTDFVADSLAQGPPVIDSFSPKSANKNWALITVKGRNFTGTTSVGIGNSNPGDFFYILDDNTLQIQTPITCGVGPITITTPVGTATSSENFIGPSLPIIYTLHPNNHTKEGDVFRLGMGGNGVSEITFGGVPATQWTGNNVTIPKGALSGFISITTDTGKAWSFDALFIDPTLTGISPTSGVVGTTVDITGRNFQNVTVVSFSGVAATNFKILSNNLIQVVVPAGAASGPIVFMNRVGGTGATSTHFTFVMPSTGPVVADLNPAAAAPYDNIVLSGMRFTGATSVSIGGVGCNFTVMTDTAILVTIPSGIKEGLVRVTTPAGSTDSYRPFTPLAERCVNIITNGSFEDGNLDWRGSYGSGALIRSSLTMPAWDLLPQSGYWTQTAGGWGWQAPRQDGTRTVDAPTSQAMLLPADASKIELRFLVGLNTEENTGVAKDFFNVQLMDATTGLMIPNGQVLQLNNLTGSDHILTPYVLDITAFKGLNVAIRMESDEDKELGTSWTMDDVQVLVYGSASTQPSVASAYPIAGYPEETLITLNGTNLLDIRSILFNGLPAVSWKRLDGNTLETTVPFGATTGSIVVVTGAGATVIPGTFSVTYHPPEADYIEPSRGPVGTPISILGKHLRGVTSVSIGGIPMTFVVDRDSQITAVIPTDAITGPIKVTGPGGTTTTGTFTVLGSGIITDVFIEKAEFIQVTQREDSGVPLVKDRQAMARVHVRGNTANTLKPSVKLSLYQGETVVFVTTIPAPSGLPGTPLNSTTADFDKTWNAVVPAQFIQPGLSVLAQVNPDGSQPEVDPTNNFWPYNGVPYALDVRDTKPFKVTFVPLAVTKNGTTYTGDVNDANTDTWLNMFKRIWPLPDVTDTLVHAPFNSQHQPDPSYNDWDPVLTELQVLRAAENIHDRYYYGAYHAWWAGILGGGSGMANFPPACVAMGIDHEYGWDPSANIFHWREATTAHELGHALSRHHTPGCGAGDPDNDFPYDDSMIGQWGYDITGSMAMDPAVRHDIMAYCGFEWVSDYVYEKVIDYRMGGTDPTISSTAGPIGSAPQDCLLVWGSVVDGEVRLRPGFAVKMVPSVHDPNATYTAEMLGPSGQSLGRIAFEPSIADHSPNRGFVVAMPLNKPAVAGKEMMVSAGPVGNVSSIKILKNSELMANSSHGSSEAATRIQASNQAPLAVRLENGMVRFTWDALAKPMVMIRNEAGQVIALAEGGSIDLVTNSRMLTIQYSGGMTVATELIQVY